MMSSIGQEKVLSGEILVCADSAVDARIVLHDLEAHGFAHAAQVSDWRQCARMLDEGKYDLVIFLIRAFDSDGYHLAIELGASRHADNGPGVSVFFLSRSSDFARLKAECAQWGVTAVQSTAQDVAAVVKTLQLEREADKAIEPSLAVPETGAPGSTEGSDLAGVVASVSSIPFAVLVVNPQGQIAYANDSAGGLFGYLRDELTGMSVEALLPERFRDKHRLQVAGFFKEPARRQVDGGSGLYGLTRSGSEIRLSVSLRPMGGYAVAIII